MLSKQQLTILLSLSVPLSALLILVSATGILTTDLYYQETLNWQLQSRGQDMVDLFIVAPLLSISTFFIIRGHHKWIPVWAATIIYLIYSFLIYTFAVSFNGLFMAYCVILGLSFYAVLFFITLLKKMHVEEKFAASGLSKLTAIYFLLISILFYGLWLSDIIPNITSGQIPDSLEETGLRTNPVHVIDLSVFLPGVFITGILLLRRQFPGLQLAQVLLIFFIIMNITIAWLQILLRKEGLVTSVAIAWFMLALAATSLLLFILLTRKYHAHLHGAKK